MNLELPAGKRACVRPDAQEKPSLPTIDGIIDLELDDSPRSTTSAVVPGLSAVAPDAAGSPCHVPVPPSSIDLEVLGGSLRSTTSDVAPGSSAVVPEVAGPLRSFPEASDKWSFFPNADDDTPLVRLDASKYLAEGIYRMIETADGGTVYIHVADYEFEPDGSLGDGPEKALLAYQARTGAPDSEASDFVNTLICTPDHPEKWHDG